MKRAARFRWGIFFSWLLFSAAASLQAATRDVTAYGATGNGSTNDTNAIQSAINACSPGDTVYFPAGTYVISQTLTLGGTGCTLNGVRNTSTILATGSADPMLHWTGLNTDSTVQNLIFDGHNFASILQFDWAMTGVVITYNKLINGYTAISAGASSKSTRNTSIDHNIIRGIISETAGTKGIHISGAISDTNIDYNYLDYLYQGIEKPPNTGPGGTMTINNNTFIRGQRAGIEFMSTQNNATISGNWFGQWRQCVAGSPECGGNYNDAGGNWFIFAQLISWATGGTGHTISNNFLECTDGMSNGIEWSAGDPSFVTNNVIKVCTVPLYITTASGNGLTGNIICTPYNTAYNTSFWSGGGGNHYYTNCSNPAVPADPPVPAPPFGSGSSQALAPTIAPNGGTFSGSVTVTLNPGGTAGAAIHYTTDGTTPTSASRVYAGPFALSVNAAVKAISTVSGSLDSAIATANFSITAPPQPVTINLATPSTLSVQPGQPITFTTHWSGGPTAVSEMIFTHFMDSSGANAFLDLDHYPSTLTTQWTTPGTFSETRTVTVPANTPLGTYKVMAGLYDANSLTYDRLLLTPGAGVTPDPGTDSVHQLRYQIATVQVTGATNTPPTATAQSVTTAEDTAKTITLAGTDPEGNALTYALVTQPTHGTLSGTGANQTYTPAANYNGSDSFTFKVNDGQVDSPAATVSITVTLVNDAPTATPQSVTTAEDTAKTIALAGTDPEGSALTYVIVAQPLHGTLSGTGANRTYTPAGNYNGSDSFTFKVNDGQVDSPAATVSITITSVNDVPVANMTATPTSGSAPLAVSFSAAGSTDPDGTIQSYSWAFGDGQTGTGASVNHTYTTSGAYTAVLTVTDNGGLQDTDSRVISAGVPPNQAPTATPQSVTTAEDTAKTIILAGTDPEGSALTYAIITQPLHGTLSGTGANQTYTPVANYNGSDSFTFRVNDGQSNSPAATVSLTVTAVNDAPNAAMTAAPASGPAPLAVSFNGASSTDIDGTIQSYSWNFGDGQTASGATASHTYAIAGSYTAVLTVTDNGGLTDTDSRVITVGTVANLPPVVGFITAAPADVNLQSSGVQEYEATTVQYMASVSDANSDPLTYQWFYTRNGGSRIAFGSPGSLPSGGGTAQVSFSYPAGSAGTQYTWIISVTDGKSNAVEQSLAVAVIAQSVSQSALPDPNLDAIKDRTFTVLDALDIPTIDGASFNWELTLVTSAGQTAAALSAGGAANVPPTNTPHLSLAPLNLTPGVYQLRVQAFNTQQQSNWMSAQITLVAANLSGIRLYPNPWRQDKHAGKNITFASLPADSSVALFTVSGRKVKDLPVSGGMALWDMTTDSGDKAASGVYVYVVNDPQGNKVKGKIAVIR